jgi:hypothetical protein
MKRIFLVLALLTVASTSAFAFSIAPAQFTFGLNRDAACLNQCVNAPCDFPPVLNPCAVPCRAPGIQGQAVPCAFDTACPSGQLPCHGVSYGAYPYPLFRVR